MPPVTNQKNSSRSAAYEMFMLGLCVYVLVMLAVETFFALDPLDITVLHYMDTVVCMFFLADFLFKFFTAESKLKYFFTWGWIDLLSSIPMIESLRWGRFARVMRVIRLLRGIRSGKVLVEMLLQRRAESTFSVVALTALLVIVFASISILHFERGAGSNIETPVDALWWAFVTVTTVGYGDKFPVTSEGRLVAAVAMTAGVALFGTFTGLIASWLLEPGEQEQEEELEMIRNRLATIEGHLETLVRSSGAAPVATAVSAPSDVVDSHEPLDVPGSPDPLVVTGAPDPDTWPTAGLHPASAPLP